MIIGHRYNLAHNQDEAKNCIVDVVDNIEEFAIELRLVNPSSETLEQYKGIIDVCNQTMPSLRETHGNNVFYLPKTIIYRMFTVHEITE